MHQPRVARNELPWDCVTTIAGQEEHHRRVSFKDEFRLMLKRYEMEFDEPYLWD